MFVMSLTLVSYVFGLIAVDMQSVTLYGLFFVMNIILGIVLLFCHTASSSKVSTTKRAVINIRKQKSF